MTFRELQLDESLLEGLSSMGFTEATPIQEKAIPVILQGRDLIACAQTGTGKTAAFLLPILHKVVTAPQEGSSTLVLVPTRELAMQIDQQLDGFGYFAGISSIAIYGGQGKTAFEAEKKALSTGADVIIATPGRLIAHLNMSYVKFGSIQHFILDEADRMLDMGFVKAIDTISKYLPKQRQTLMFSATMAPKIKKLARQILKDPAFIQLAVSKPAEKILQAVYEVKEEHKLPLIEYVCNPSREKDGLVLVFCSQKVSVKAITKSLKRLGLSAAEIHSDLEQSERQETLRHFQNGRYSILVATDILSRGIDVDGIRLVINYDMPNDPEDYIHRIGRTARADANGSAISFITRKDKRKLQKVERLMEKQVHKLRVPKVILESAGVRVR